MMTEFSFSVEKKSPLGVRFLGSNFEALHHRVIFAFNLIEISELCMQ